MGHFTTLFGYINCDEDFFEENRESINALSADDTWPYLTRDLFAAPNSEHSYDGQLITFGTIYNGVERVWEEWLNKFEKLLRTMHWSDAHVYLQTEWWGNYHYTWQFLIPNTASLMEDTTSPSSDHWDFFGGPRTRLRELYQDDKPNR